MLLIMVLVLCSLLLPAPFAAQAFFNFPAGSSQVAIKDGRTKEVPGAAARRQPQVEAGRKVQTIQALKDLMAEFASRTPGEDSVINAPGETAKESSLTRGSIPESRPEVERGGPRGSSSRASPLAGKQAKDLVQVYAPELDPINVQKRPRLRLPETDVSTAVKPSFDQLSSLQEFIPSCPDSSFSYIIPSPVQCDLYYLCEFGEASRRLCEDGLVFSLEQVKCVAPELENCQGRPLLQPPQGTGPCTRRNGIFYSNNTCTEFVTCRDNNPAFERCAEGLVFDPQQKICAWSDEALRPNCLPEDLLGFRCPNPKLSIEDAISQRVHLRFGDHDRFADPKDCRYFFMCLRTGHPRRAGCGQGQVFDRSVGICRPAKEVSECADYYGAADPVTSDSNTQEPAKIQADNSRLARIEDDINRQFAEARRRLQQQNQRALAKREIAEPEPEPE